MANDLTTTSAPVRALTTPCLPVSVKPLVADQPGRVIFGEDGQFDTVDAEWQLPAVVTDEQRQDARRALAEYERHLAPAPVEHIGGRVLGALAHHYVPNMPSKVSAIVADDWLEDLGEFPAWAVDEAFKRWRRMEERKPTIAGIRDLCHRIVRKDRQTVERLRKIADHGAPVGNVVQIPSMRRMTERAPVDVAEEAFARVRQALADAPPVAPVERGSDAEPTDRAESIRRGMQSLSTFQRVPKGAA